LRQANSVYVLDCLRAAVESWRQGLADGMVTAPVHKGIINEAGHSFSGHTEYFARAGHVSRVVMMLVARRLRVALVTTHIPISHVPRAVTQPAIESACRITEEALRLDFGISAPKLAVCGLNPHAGESGHMGDEEIRVIQPALERLKEQNQLSVSGPWPADTIFAPQRAAEYDAVIAMYHDQGLAPLKAIGFGQAVNVTLGLPFIRTSVDHGTALNLAGTGQADNSSFIEALNLAQQLAIRRIG
jgi:4-hydroxythreonine-4-phosphate dehydrogenase